METWCGSSQNQKHLAQKGENFIIQLLPPACTRVFLYVCACVAFLTYGTFQTPERAII